MTSMKIIEITEDKVERLSEHIEKALRHAGKAMQALEEFYGEGYGERGHYGERDDDWDDDERYGERYDYGRGGRRMGERRRRDSRGRYA